MCQCTNPFKVREPSKCVHISTQLFEFVNQKLKHRVWIWFSTSTKNIVVHSLPRKLFNSYIALHSTNNRNVNWTTDFVAVDEKKWMRKTIEKSSIVRFVPAISYVDFVDKKNRTISFTLFTIAFGASSRLLNQCRMNNRNTEVPRNPDFQSFLCGNNLIKLHFGALIFMKLWQLEMCAAQV